MNGPALTAPFAVDTKKFTREPPVKFRPMMTNLLPTSITTLGMMLVMIGAPGPGVTVGDGVGVLVGVGVGVRVKAGVRVGVLVAVCVGVRVGVRVAVCAGVRVAVCVGGRVAADLAGAPDRIVKRMGRLGTAIGLAFQMVDDVLDIIGPESKIGKPVGSDLRAGIPSLPVVLGVGRSHELRELFQSGNGGDGAGFDRALELVRAPEVLAASRQKADEQAALAHHELTCLKPSIYRDCLAAMINDQADREV